MAAPDAEELERIAAERDRIRSTYLSPDLSRPVSSARGLHHVAIVCADVETTIGFYQDLLEFPLTEIVENRDYPGSNHFFFDIGNGAEVLGGLHHLAISVDPNRWSVLRTKLDEAGVDYLQESGSSIYLRDPDGTRVELISDPLGEMYGTVVL